MGLLDELTEMHKKTKGKDFNDYKPDWEISDLLKKKKRKKRKRK